MSEYMLKMEKSIKVFKKIIIKHHNSTIPIIGNKIIVLYIYKK
jgi:hypothetical protein